MYDESSILIIKLKIINKLIYRNAIVLITISL
jgi:hypothetical protein